MKYIQLISMDIDGGVINWKSKNCMKILAYGEAVCPLNVFTHKIDDKSPPFRLELIMMMMILVEIQHICKQISGCLCLYSRWCACEPRCEHTFSNSIKNIHDKYLSFVVVILNCAENWVLIEIETGIFVQSSLFFSTLVCANVFTIFESSCSSSVVRMRHSILITWHRLEQHSLEKVFVFVLAKKLFALVASHQCSWIAGTFLQLNNVLGVLLSTASNVFNPGGEKTQCLYFIWMNESINRSFDNEKRFSMRNWMPKMADKNEQKRENWFVLDYSHPSLFIVVVQKCYCCRC